VQLAGWDEARGKPVFVHSSHSTVSQAARCEHSRKPDEFYAMVETTSLALGRFGLKCGIHWTLHPILFAERYVLAFKRC
jgi:hypothetical protein